MRRSSMRCERQWGNRSHECEEQQQSCGQAMHGASAFEAYQLAVDESKNEAAPLADTGG
ncbi:MAG: hypothetical protein WAM13_18285 [Candidatus Sulfotelmatobacter sp.]